MYSQNTFLIEDFSDQYYGKIYVEDATSVFSAGWVAIYEKGSDKELIKIESEELAVNYINEKSIKLNVHELPFGEQSLILYGDFNFDGIKDFAIQDGQNSCYHGPSYLIYLADDKEWIYSADFSELSQAYCGMFDIDSTKKRLYTMTKSGCCWHQFSEYKVVNNKPKLIRVEEQAMPANGCFLEIALSQIESDSMNTSIHHTLLVENIEVLFSFKLKKTKKEVVLLRCGEDLRYAFLTKDGEVEFAYPSVSDIGSNDPFDFELRKDLSIKRDLINFSTSDASYQIYNTNKKVGVKVTTNGKVYDMEGNILTRKGSVDSIFTSKELNNVQVID